MEKKKNYLVNFSVENDFEKVHNDLRVFFDHFTKEMKKFELNAETNYLNLPMEVLNNVTDHNTFSFCSNSVNIIEAINQYRQCYVILKTLNFVVKQEKLNGSSILNISPSQQPGIDILGETKAGLFWGIEIFGGGNVQSNDKLKSDFVSLINYRHGESKKPLDSMFFACLDSAWPEDAKGNRYKPKPSKFFESECINISEYDNVFSTEESIVVAEIIKINKNSNF